ncbi:MAG: hypothetical protein CBD18_06370 [Opitutales bacterium TMED158]|nr:MAG: hypothetical protein CBD18_06370 [Opitutales bacterium TMED158]
MNVNNNNNASHLYTQNLANRQSSKPTPSVESSSLGSTAGSEKVDLSGLEALRSAPEVRPEVVAKGKELLNDPNYPSKEIMDSIAKLIVPFADDE